MFCLSQKSMRRSVVDSMLKDQPKNKCLYIRLKAFIELSWFISCSVSMFLAETRKQWVYLNLVEFFLKIVVIIYGRGCCC